MQLIIPRALKYIRDQGLCSGDKDLASCCNLVEDAASMPLIIEVHEQQIYHDMAQCQVCTAKATEGKRIP